MAGSVAQPIRQCEEPGCTAAARFARHGMTRYCLKHSTRQGTTLTVKDRAAKRPRLPDCDSTWSGHPITRLEAQRIRAELTRQLRAIWSPWDEQCAADRAALNLDTAFRHGP